MSTCSLCAKHCTWHWEHKGKIMRYGPFLWYIQSSWWHRNELMVTWTDNYKVGKVLLKGKSRSCESIKFCLVWGITLASQRIEPLSCTLKSEQEFTRTEKGIGKCKCQASWLVYKKLGWGWVVVQRYEKLTGARLSRVLRCLVFIMRTVASGILLNKGYQLHGSHLVLQSFPRFLPPQMYGAPENSSLLSHGLLVFGPPRTSGIFLYSTPFPFP